MDIEIRRSERQQRAQEKAKEAMRKSGKVKEREPRKLPMWKLPIRDVLSLTCRTILEKLKMMAFQLLLNNE